MARSGPLTEEEKEADRRMAEYGRQQDEGEDKQSADKPDPPRS